MYERSHFVKEINKCRDFRTAADDIEMVSDQEFYRAIGTPTDDKHALTIARLEHETKSRQTLLEELEKLKVLNAKKKKTISI